MKTLVIIILCGIAGLSATVYLAGSSAMTEVSVLRDITDSHLSQPKASEIIPLFDFDNQKWNGGIFRFADLSDVSFTPAREVKISNANEWLSNQYDRAKSITKFNTEIGDILTVAGNETVGKSHSSVYMPLAQELNRLSQNKATRRVLLVYSDLMENDPTVSFYDTHTLALLSSDYNKSVNALNAQLPIQNLKGIEVYLLYEPTDVATDGRYKIVSGFYKKLLESKEATVTISANLMQ